MRPQTGLSDYQPADAEEARHLARIREFAALHENPFDRRHLHAHLVGSALVVSVDGKRVLLLHHKRLNRWLQCGGHGEPGESSGETIALREAFEETGLAGLRLHDRAPRPFDVDVHRIPARGDEAAHDHLDLRYLVVAPDDAVPERCLEETNDMRWFEWDEASGLDLDPGLRRLMAKARATVCRDTHEEK